MEIPEILRELRQQRELIIEAIASLERLAAGQGKRRGRPPSWLLQAANGAEAPAARKKTAPKT